MPAERVPGNRIATRRHHFESLRVYYSWYRSCKTTDSGYAAATAALGEI